MGTLGQLMLENREDEALKVAGFFADVGLPNHLEQLSIETGDSAALDTIVQGAMTFPTTANMPMELDERIIRTALLEADELGRKVSGNRGEAAFRRLHGD